MKNIKTKNRLFLYSALAGSVTTISVTADAQMVYTDIDPDVVLDIDYSTFASYDLEITAEPDGLFLVFYNYAKQYYYIDGDLVKYNYWQNMYFTPPFSASLIGTADDHGNAALLNTGDLIGPENHWVNSFGLPNIYIFSYGAERELTGENISTIRRGDWIGESEKCTGIRFLIDGEKHYGWIRLSVAEIDGNYGIVTIHDFAYGEQPNAKVGACSLQPPQHVVDIDTYFNIFSAGNIITIENKFPGLETPLVKIYNLQMQLMATEVLTERTTNIIMENASPGAYIVSVIQGNNVLSKQVMSVY